MAYAVMASIVMAFVKRCSSRAVEGMQGSLMVGTIVNIMVDIIVDMMVENNGR